MPVPIIPQATDFSCGSACLYACLLYWKGESLPVLHEADLWEAVKIDVEAGMGHDEGAEVATRYGLLAEARAYNEEELEALVARGVTVIVCIQAWRDLADNPTEYEQDWDDGHYVVVVGLDAEKVYFMDPSTRTSYTYMSREEFRQRWHSPDWDGAPQYGMGVAIWGEGSPALPCFPAPMRHLG